MPQSGQELRIAEKYRSIFPLWWDKPFVALTEVRKAGSQDCPVWQFKDPDGGVVELGLDWFGESNAARAGPERLFGGDLFRRLFHWAMISIFILAAGMTLIIANDALDSVLDNIAVLWNGFISFSRDLGH